MSHRYSRNEKGKGKDESFPLRKPLVRVPDSDVSELIDRNKLTLIGRVTNPAIQKTRALVDFFLQQWQVVGRITGRDLGPSLFQFNFESEHDLQTILSRAPFHFKRWMFILRRWEPIISDSFPAMIPFWINVHGIPLHYWTDDTIIAIGKALGPIENREVTKARLRVLVNGLEPLIMKVDLQLPSRDVVEVELEYEKLEKHCFFCKSLTHEEGYCPHRPTARSQDDGRRSLGITQQNTLERIEEGRRRQEARKVSRHQGLSRFGEAQWTTRNSNRRFDAISSSGISDRRDTDRSSAFEENRRRYDDNRLPQITDSFHEIPPRRNNQDRRDSSHRSQGSHVNDSPVPDQPKESFISPIREVSSRSNHSPTGNLPTDPKRKDMASRLSDPRGSLVSSDERLSAKNRLSVQTRRTTHSEASVDPSQMIGQAALITEASVCPQAGLAITRPSSSNVFEAGRLGPCERSPIRTLSEDRVHVSLRLGPLISEPEETSDDSTGLQLLDASSKKAAGKRVATNYQGSKRTTRSPIQGNSGKRRRVIKTHNSPRRKLMLDAITAGGKKGKKTTTSKPTTKILPAMVRKEKDFLLT